MTIKMDRALNLFHVFCICLGPMLAGIFIMPGKAYEMAGPAILVSFFLAGLLTAGAMLSQAELASAMPRSGGAYFYVARAMGSLVGAVYGLITWFSLALKSAYELLFIGLALQLLSGWIPAQLTAILLCLFFIVINYAGIRKTSHMEAFLLISVVAALALYFVIGLPKVDVRDYYPFAPHGSWAILAAAGYTLVAFAGPLKIISVAEEVEDPGRNVPQGMILAMSVVIVIYLGIVFVTIGLHSGGALTGLDSPISTGAAVAMGSVGEIVFLLIGLVAVFSSANTGVLSASRYPLALSRDGVVPAFMGELHPRFRTPHHAVLITGVFVIVCLLLDITVLVMTTSCVMILTFLANGLTVIILREGRLQNYQPTFHCPFYPWMQIVTSVGLLVLLVATGPTPLALTAGLVVSAAAIYWVFGRIRETREYALLHLIERITAREITSHSLENELRDIIRERDELCKDRFDDLVEECPILDIPEHITAEIFFLQAAECMCPRLGCEAQTLYERFKQRESESPTALTPNMAIPHIIIDGEKQFGLLIARCKDGIEFGPDANNVRTVFLLIGARDQRPFHLRALAAIAQIVSDPSFDQRWLEARNIETLRDIVLLAKRHRHLPDPPATGDACPPATASADA